MPQFESLTWRSSRLRLNSVQGVQNLQMYDMQINGHKLVAAALNPDAPVVRDAAEGIYGELLAQGVEVFFDDRDECPGVKFNDADLVGFPVRVVVGKRGVEQGQVELSLRRDREKTPVALADAVSKARELLDSA